MNTPVLARLATAPTQSVIESGSLPADIQWMPPGVHTIQASQDRRAVEKRVRVHAGTARTMQRTLEDHLAASAANTGDLPYLDFNHEDGQAAAHPQEFYWAGDDSRAGGVRARVRWTESGRQAVLGKAFRRFSPSFFVDAAGEVIGAPLNMGGLVNRAAFKTIQPLFAKGSGSPLSTEQVWNQKYAPKAPSAVRANAAGQPKSTAEIWNESLAPKRGSAEKNLSQWVELFAANHRMTRDEVFARMAHAFAHPFLHKVRANLRGTDLAPADAFHRALKADPDSFAEWAADISGFGDAAK